MATKRTKWTFADATERDTHVGFGSGVNDGDCCILLSDYSMWAYNGTAWIQSPATASSLSAVLLVGNTSGASDIEVSAAQAVRGVDGGTGAGLTVRGGAGSTSLGGPLTLQGGSAAGTGNGGDLILAGGIAAGTGTDGTVSVTGSTASVTSSDADLSLNVLGGNNLVVNADGTFFQSDSGAFVVIGKSPFANTVSLDLASSATGTLENSLAGGVLELRTFTTGAATNTGNLTVNTGANANAVSGDTGDLILGTGSVTNAASAGTSGDVALIAGTAAGSGNGGNILLTPGSTGSGTEGTVRITGKGQSLHGGNATRRFQILGGTQTAITGDSTGPSVYLEAQGTAARDGAQVTVSNSVVGNGSFVARGGNALSGTTAGGSADLIAGIGFGAGAGAQSSIQAGNGGATGNGGYAFVLAGNAGATSGNGGGVVITAKDATGSGLGGPVNITAGGSPTGTPGDINLTTDGGLVKIRTTSGFAGSERVSQTYGVQFTSPSGGGVLDMVTLGTLDTNGRNLKVKLHVTAQNSVVDDDFISAVIQTAAYRAGGTVSVVTTPALTSHEGNSSGTNPTFVADLFFAVAATGNDIRLTLRNSSSTTTYTLNTAVEWSVQEGGFSS